MNQKVHTTSAPSDYIVSFDKFEKKFAIFVLSNRRRFENMKVSAVFSISLGNNVFYSGAMACAGSELYLYTNRDRLYSAHLDPDHGPCFAKLLCSHRPISYEKALVSISPEHVLLLGNSYDGQEERLLVDLYSRALDKWYHLAVSEIGYGSGLFLDPKPILHPDGRHVLVCLSGLVHDPDLCSIDILDPEAGISALGVTADPSRLVAVSPFELMFHEHGLGNGQHLWSRYALTNMHDKCGETRLVWGSYVSAVTISHGKLWEISERQIVSMSLKTHVGRTMDIQWR